MGYLIIESEDEVRLMFDGTVESGHLRLPTTQQTDEFLALAAERTGGAVIDFHQQRCMSSRMLGWLIELRKALQVHSSTLRLVNVSPDVRKMFMLMKVDKMFRIDDDDDEPPLGVVAV